MKIIHHFITASLLISSLVILTLSQISSADDTDVMLKLAKSITPAPPGWSGRDPCKWIGVSCSAGSVININLKSKFFSGKIPPEISQLSNLRIISFQQNNFDGPLPPLSNMGSLQKVYLNENGFTSIPPGFLSDLPSLQTISISNNPLKPWTIPDILTNLTSLQTFEAANTSLYGEIPDFFNSLPSLQELRLSYNNLTGPLPTSFGGSSIQKLWVNNMEKDHGLSGSIEVLAKMPSLTQAWLHGNAFEGPIPSDLSNCTQLFDLNLGSNMLTGPVPESLTKLQSLQNVSLQGNFLQGPMPVFGKGVDATFGSNVFCNPKPGPCDPQVTTLIEIAGAMGYPKSLAQTWTGNDACNGPWAHITCDTRKTVTGINLAKQGLSGTISPAFSNLSSLTTVILTGNGLYGKVPKELTNLKQLRRLDVSNNNLTGEVPKFASGVRLDVSGNKFLGSNVDTTPKSPPSDVISSGDEGRSSESSTEGGEGSSKSSRSYTWIVIVVVVAVVIVVLLILIVLYKKRKLRFGHGYDEESSGTMMKKRTTTTTMMKPISRSSSSFKKSSPQIHALDGGNVVYPMGLLQEATNNFSEKNVLGRGGFGVVYLGVLADGTHIAVKRMESSSIGNKGMNEFEAEIGVLSRVRHRHLVALLGYCVNGNDKIVVYEYMPQGTMAQHLFEWRVKGLPCLTWKQRLVIALDVARGVEYLHSLAQQSFIHRDLKPSNVLLGNDMRAKVSDFGLVKLAPDGKYSLETRLAGTFGYLAPEYASTGRVTTKIDVFAYGVILMEMITGRKALDDSLPEEMVQLSYWFRRVLITKDLDQISKHIDPALNPVDQEKLNSIQKVAELAGHCTAREPKERPDMSHAVSVLLPLVEDWRPKPTAPNYEDSVNMSMESIPLAMKKWQSGDTTFEDYPISSSTTDQSSFPTDATPSTKSTTRDHGPS